MPTQLAHTPRLNKEGLGVVELTVRKVSDYGYFILLLSIWSAFTKCILI